MSISQSFLPEFDQEMASTRKILERVPEGKFDYKPHEKSMSLGRLAAHVAEMPGWGKTTFETEALNIDMASYKPWLPTTRKELLEMFDKNVKEARERLAAATDEEFARTWTLTAGNQTIFSVPRVAVFRSSVMNHMIHHRAQLGVYLRLNNVEIPGMYGPSADEMQAFTAQNG
jgi:uncharacterized damage-inducible protein DinB